MIKAYLQEKTNRKKKVFEKVSVKFVQNILMSFLIFRMKLKHSVMIFLFLSVHLNASVMSA